MAKTRTTITVEPWEECYTALVHVGYGGRQFPPDWHIIYAYHAWEFPYDSMAYHVHNTFDEAMAEAEQWARMPEICCDICYYCRMGQNGPHVPRWNIYRGPDDKPTIPGLLWSYWWAPPPWPPLPW